jgi:hypothetical protein
MKNTEVQLMPWGRRQSQAGNLPLGGWARLDSIKKRLWQKYFAMPIKIPVLKFAEKDIEGKTHWFPLASGQFIQGLHATYDDEVRFYIVTIALEDKNTIHDRWPRILVQPE